jgi:hypothetical protein
MHTERADETATTTHPDRAVARRARIVVAAIAAALPYIILKLTWLTGGSVGSATAAGAASLHDPRHTVGNLVTLAMQLVAILLVLALLDRRGRKLPAPALLLPLWVGSGLLTPIALGLPFGLLAQAFVGGSPTPAHNGLQGWVYVVVYGGFAVQALALASAFVFHARVRWPGVFELRVQDLAGPNAGRVTRTLARAGALAASIYGAVQLAWALAGTRLGAPSGFDTLTQRSVFVSTGLLALGGAWAVLALSQRAPAPARLQTPVVIAWLGSATAFASALAGYALRETARPAPATTLLLALGAVAGVTLAGAGLCSHDAGRHALAGTAPRRGGVASVALRARAKASHGNALTQHPRRQPAGRREERLRATLRG